MARRSGGGTVIGVIGRIGALLALAYEVYLLYSTRQSPTRQGLHDIQAGTMVVRRAR
jgi:hypothetical protein